MRGRTALCNTAVQLTRRPLRAVVPTAKCKLRQLKLERIKDYLLMEEEFIRNQEILKPKEEKDRVRAAAGARGARVADARRDPLVCCCCPAQQEERAKLEDLRGTPLGIGTLEEIIDDSHAIVSVPNGPEYYVCIMSFVDKDLLEPGTSVLMHHKVRAAQRSRCVAPHRTVPYCAVLCRTVPHHVAPCRSSRPARRQTNAVVGILNDETDPMVSVMKVDKAPQETYADIGGLDEQVQEIKESVELPLTHPELYEDIGIRPPKGVILYGEPGTGKTLLAKAVANSTSATFLRVVGSELIQKYLGEGPKLVRELFRVASDLAPTIVFIDEIDAVGTKRYDAHSGGEKEIQRTMLELLNQLDGFDERGDVKVRVLLPARAQLLLAARRTLTHAATVQVIMATNRIESLDPALLRPGRIDRKIRFPLPDTKTKRHIFQVRALLGRRCGAATSAAHVAAATHATRRRCPLTDPYWQNEPG